MEEGDHPGFGLVQGLEMVKRRLTGALFLLLVVIFPAQAEEAGGIVRALLQPERETTLASQIAGRILKIPKNNGDRFDDGDLLLEMDCRLMAGNLKRARAELEAAKKQDAANRAQIAYGSIGKLEAALSAAEVKKFEAQVEIGRTRVSMCRIAAPFAGRVVKRHVNPYQSVKVGDPLMEILDDARLQVLLYLPSEWMKRVGPGTPFTLAIDETGKSYRGAIRLLGARVDAASRTIEAIGDLKGQHAELLSGMSGNARMDAGP